MTDVRLLMACYIVVGALATYGRGVVVGYLVGLLFASVLCWASGRSVGRCIVGATIVAVFMCFGPVTPGMIEIVLATILSGLICSAIRGKLPSARDHLSLPKKD